MNMERARSKRWRGDNKKIMPVYRQTTRQGWHAQSSTVNRCRTRCLQFGHPMRGKKDRRAEIKASW